MRVCRASRVGVLGGSPHPRHSCFQLTRRTCPTRIRFGFFTVFLLRFHRPRQPPRTEWRLAILAIVSPRLTRTVLPAAVDLVVGFLTEAS